MEKKVKEEADRLLNILKGLDPAEDKYSKVVENYKLLCEARSKRAWYHIEPQIAADWGVKILLTVLVLNHERFNIISSKSFSWIFHK